MSQHKPLLVTLDTNVILALANGEPDAPAVRDLIELQEQGAIKLRIDISFVRERQHRGIRRDHLAYLRALGFGDAEYLAGPTSTMGFQPVDEPTTTIWDLGLQQAVVHTISQVIHPMIPFSWQDYLKEICMKHCVKLDDMLAANWDRNTRLCPWVPAPHHQLDDATVHHLREVWRTYQQKWTNAKNDALALYNHVTWNGAVFVTSDKDVLKRRDKLRRLVLRVMVEEEGPDGYLEPREHEIIYLMTSEILRPAAAVAYLREKTGMETRSNVDEQ